MPVSSPLTNPFRLDSRSLALFRILIAVVVIIDLSTRLSLVQVFLGSGGLPNPEDPTLFPSWLWSVHRLHGGITTAISLLLVQMGVAAAVLVGWRSRQSFIALTLLTLSLHNANPYILDGGDRSLMVMMIWACFLPLGQHWSLDAHQGPAPAAPPTNGVYSLASITLTLQICLIYWVTVSHKSVDHWVIQRDAVWYALNLDHFATRFGAWAARFQPFTSLSSITAYAIQLLAPISVLWPTRIWQVRLGGLMVLATMHLGFIPFLELGLFPWISLTGLVALIPGEFWAVVSRLLPDRPTTQPTTESPCFPSPEPKRYRLLKRISNPLLILLITLALITAVSDRSRPAGLAPDLEPIKALGIHQSWKMFAPLPQPVDYWFELVETGFPSPASPAQERRLLLPGLESFSGPGNPRRQGHRVHTQRWRKFIDNLYSHRHRENLARSYVRHLCLQTEPGEVPGLQQEWDLVRIEEPTGVVGHPASHPVRLPIARFRCR
ncbi:hypothetical protein KBY71_09230 [Cyanobium sp. T1B-Tous]|uniref:hypothetical protein n=1 Tax=Cyanobium sp. T1B-Tous TaxID=2823721 RepID=UPI0020CEAE1D|nr:hypothetical protein [Cyanobium sp. T1B-Tous]MCP9806695.1 hypothetical protein [Cyanobium sp. T1B-Tous]